VSKVLVTGGCGYIGSHTIVDLIENGFEVISVDNFSRSNPIIFDGIEKITGKKVKNYNLDLKDKVACEQIFLENKDLEGIINFAAYKMVGESVHDPILYYENNLGSLTNLLYWIQKYEIQNFVFSSSCSVYGNANKLPVDESEPMKKAESPYANTKQIGEAIIENLTHAYPLRYMLLRYFNPAGAHPSSEIGEMPIDKPQNLVPYITKTATGELKQLTIHGNDYGTKDGTCIRDYIHVSDIASAHTAALKKMMEDQSGNYSKIFNLGAGIGRSVTEAVLTFEKVNNLKLNYTYGPRRAGDVVSIYGDNKKAKQELGWDIRYSFEDIMKTAYDWEKALKTKKW